MSKRSRKAKTPVRPVRKVSPRHAWLIAAALAALAIVVFASLRHASFVQLDDPGYVSANPHLANGLTPTAIGWAFTTFDNANWHPLTWLSHLIDVQLFGLEPGAHHMTNVLLHAINTALLFLVLWSMTVETGRSAFVAALFAVHPLHVESVAWISERKDVLSTMLWLLTMVAYVRYVRVPTGRRYALVVTAFALGLMAKPMLVTLPVALLLLDWWPLKRFEGAGVRALVVEKLPLFALSAVSSVITVLAQRHGGAVMTLESMPASVRVENAIVSYAMYVWKAIWPADLAMFYPYQTNIDAVVIAAAALFLIAITTAVAWRAGRHRAPLVGWLWYLGTLVPVVGLVQVGRQAMADRYTYVPFIGLFIAVAWALPSLAARSARTRRIAAAVATALIVACGFATRAQIRHWQSNASFWERAVTVTLDLDPDRARAVVSSLTGKDGRVSDAIAALFRVGPAEARRDVGSIFLQTGRLADAEAVLTNAVAERPDDALAHDYLGRSRAAQGRFADAIEPLQRAVALDPSRQQTHADLGRVLGQLGRISEAHTHLAEAVRLKPGDAASRNDLGLALANQGRFEEAMKEYTAALAIDPTIPELFNNFGLLYAAQGRLHEAADEFSKAIKLRPTYLEALRNLGIAYLKLGKPAEAQQAFRAVLQLKPDDETARKGLEVIGRFSPRP